MVKNEHPPVLHFQPFTPAPYETVMGEQPAGGKRVEKIN